jgi:uncharacterized membrane protein
MYSKNRLEALSDAIFAIVMTLLVLELKVPTDIVPGHLWDLLRLEGDDWLAFVITFFIAARYWMLQHNVFQLTDHYTHRAAVLSFTFLGFVTILPFSTSLMGRHGSEPVAFFIYCANQTAIGVALIAKLEFLRVRDNIPKSGEVQRLRARLYSLTIAMTLSAAFTWVIPFRYAGILPILTASLGRRILFRKTVPA